MKKESTSKKKTTVAPAKSSKKKVVAAPPVDKPVVTKAPIKKEAPKKEIVFATETQKNLFEHFLIPEIKIGYWVNAKPHGHHKAFDGVVLRVAKNGDKVGFTFIPELDYNFSNQWVFSELKNEVTLAMKVLTIIPNYPIKHATEDAQLISPDLFEMDIPNIKSILDNLDKINDKLKKRGISAMAKSQITRLYELRLRLEEYGITKEVAAKIEANEYTKGDLKKDLAEITDMVKKVKTRNYHVGKVETEAPKKRGRGKAKEKNVGKEDNSSMRLAGNDNHTST